MDWKRLLSSKRLKVTGEARPRSGGRTEFEADIDKIVFDGAFRRLSRKTQVHPLAANDHVHTRLTHSLEVAQVGRALGRALGDKIRRHLPKGRSSADVAAVLQAACLAHDIGNPPFGHGGEEAMAHWFDVKGKDYFKGLSRNHQRDVASFEGNAQGFRILTQTANHVFDGGLRLTHAVLGTFLKYPWSSRNRDSTNEKFGAFLSEESILDDVAEELGLVRKGAHKWTRHPLAFLAEAADDICYAVIDLEDAVELRILAYDEVEELLLGLFRSKRSAAIKAGLASRDMYRVNLARLRGPVFDELVQAAVEGFMGSYDSIMRGERVEDVFTLLPDSDERKNLIGKAKDLARKEVFSDQKKTELELGSYAMFESLLDAFCQAAIDRARAMGGRRAGSAKTDLVMKLLGDHAPSKSNAPLGSRWTEYQCLRRVIDFISGMTDNYAVYIANQLQGMGSAGVQRP